MNSFQDLLVKALRGGKGATMELAATPHAVRAHRLMGW
jgi:hypothetical protein